MTALINVQDLVGDSDDGLVLMDFIKTRGTQLPYVFKHKDLSGALLGLLNDALRKAAIPGAYFNPSMLFSRQVL
jgi:hypothetical protein